MSTTEEDSRDDAPVLRTTILPGKLLLAVGLFNTLGGLFILHNGIQTWRMPVEQFRAQQKQALEYAQARGWISDDYRKQIETQPADEAKAMAEFVFVGWGVLALIAAFLTTYGGVNLRSLNSYPLAMTGAILAVIPGISPMGCCGFGEVIGLWSIVVLLNREVRGAFASAEERMKDDQETDYRRS
jgi:hypothetical protein